MKKMLLTALMLALCLALLPTPAARADVIIEPYGDPFYEEHSDQCEYIDRLYDSPAQVQAMASPKLEEVTATYPAGTRFYISHRYIDANGVEWGAYTEKQWIRLDSLTKVYDSRDFIADHQQELTDYAGELDGYTIQEVLYFWRYPGSDEIVDKFSDSMDFRADYASSVYVDKNGDGWAYFPYLCGAEGWVYIPDPESVEPHLLAAVPTPTAEAQASAVPSPSASPSASSAPASSPVPASSPASDRVLLYWVIGGVAAAVLLSALAIAVFYRKKQR